MVVSIQSIDKGSEILKQSGSEFQQAKTASDYSRFELVSLLQSTLDLESLLKYFLDNINDILRVDGISYHEDEREILIKQGKQAPHSCGYRLINGNHYYGELEFKRSKRFTESEMEQIEELVILLLIPIGNALKYFDAIRQAFDIPALNIGSKAALDETLTREIELAKRHNHPLSLLLLSFDSSIHKKTTKLPASVVSGIAESVSQVCRNTDMLFRSGGKEFRLIAHNDDSEARNISRRINKALKNKFGDDDSYGLVSHMSCVSLTGTDSAKSLLERAKNQLT